ncbi:MAG: DUF89 family protein [Campylobacterales bacterium]|nr:DUF89 family protein [Campylobacterales bacterium]
MNIQPQCVECIINQSKKVASAIGADDALSNKLTSTAMQMSKKFCFSSNPPEVATDVYKEMARIACKYDLYDEVKEASTKKAKSFIPILKDELAKSDNKLLTATKIAVAGNVIDLAAEVEFDLHEELEKIFHTDFAYDDFEMMQQKLSNAKDVVILGDNVGEHIFDYMFIEVLKELYPNVNYSYFVRGNPIINDVTIKEAKEAGFDKLCNLVDSGVNTPGFTYNRANKDAKGFFDKADIVIAKGMGNYECLSPSHKKDICFLLKVKCQVVASSLKLEVGDIVCKMA